MDLDENPELQYGPSSSLDASDSFPSMPDWELHWSQTTCVPNKIHIIGLDTFSDSDLRGFITEHFPVASIQKIEWIDDTGANVVFSSEAVASDALVALSRIPIQDISAIPPGESVAAKSYASKPDVMLNVRLSVLSDRKRPGAAKFSRYYLLHPEDDPEERHRQKYRNRDNDYPRSRRVRAKDRSLSPPSKRIELLSPGSTSRNKSRAVEITKNKELFPLKRSTFEKTRLSEQDEVLASVSDISMTETSQPQSEKMLSSPRLQFDSDELFIKGRANNSTRELFPNKTLTTGRQNKTIG